jgi:hypothetical protein
LFPLNLKASDQAVFNQSSQRFRHVLWRAGNTKELGDPNVKGPAENARRKYTDRKKLKVGCG